MFLFLLFIIPICYSAHPATVVNTNPSIGLEIQYPMFETYKLNGDIEFLFHVYNKSNGLIMTNETTSCIFDLYNQSGAEIYSSIPIIDTNLREFETTIIGTNFSSIGTYSYMIDCNTSSLGGFSSVVFEITHDGRDSESSKFGAIALVIILLGAMGTFLFLGNVFWQVEENWTFYLSYLFWYISLLFPLIGIGIVTNIPSLNPNVYNLLLSLYSIYARVYETLFIFFVVYIIVLVLSWAINWNKTPKWKMKLREYGGEE